MVFTYNIPILGPYTGVKGVLLGLYLYVFRENMHNMVIFNSLQKERYSCIFMYIEK